MFDLCKDEHCAGCGLSEPLTSFGDYGLCDDCIDAMRDWSDHDIEHEESKEEPC